MAASQLAVLGVISVDYKEVQVLRTFISDRGKIRSRALTGLSRRERHMAKP